MIRRYRIGTPIPTEAVVRELPIEAGFLPGWKLEQAENAFSYQMEDSDVVYGLGESVRGMNKRGWRYTSNCSDDPYHLEEKHSLYGAHNFILISGWQSSFGLYVDTPGTVHFDIGYSQLSQVLIRLEDFDADLYLIQGETPAQIAKEFRGLIGRSYLPPRWAFGYGQSRWSYLDAQEIRDLADRYERAGIPLDAIYLDIDYMDHYKDFTINKETFPDFPGFVEEMRRRGIHLVPIIDAGVKIEEGYQIYEEGLAGGYFCKKQDGTELVAAVWPGRVHFPDFLDPRVREWFGEKYAFLLQQGIDGFWNDMNEPAIFYTQDHLEEVFDQIDDYRNQNLDIQSFFAFKDLVGTLDNHPEDYRRFYHHYQGKMVRHDKVHNLYGYHMTRAAGEVFARLCPDRRILMFSRSSYIGMHRYAGIWTGDNRSWWSHLLLNIQQLPGLNLCGFLYCGADTGGFGADATRDLMLRWMQVSLFTPLFRNHSAMGTRRQELDAFGDTEDFRRLVCLRYALLPYLYSEFMKATLRDEMYFAPLSFAYLQDQRAREVEDQLLVGDSIMIAPVYLQNARGRYVYLPEEMKLLRMRGASDYDVEVLEAGDHYIRCELEEVLLFLRRGKVLPLAEGVEKQGMLRTEEAFALPLRYLTFEAEAVSYELYTDDGISRINE